MKIALYGATGMVGSRVAVEARSRGHEVTGFSRHGGTDTHLGDASNPDAVAEVAAEHDVVVSAVAPTATSDGHPEVFAEQIRGMADAVAATRLIVVGGAGSLLAADGSRLVDGPDFPAAYRAGSVAQAAALDALRNARTELDWTYLSRLPR